MDKIKALNTKVMAKDFGRVGLGTLAIAAGAFLWGKFLYGRGARLPTLDVRDVSGRIRKHDGKGR